MKLIFKALKFFSAKSSKQINLNIKIDQLINKYEDYFIKEANFFQLPLSKQDSILAYTNRFAKTVLNNSHVTSQKKKSHFRKIKGSMISNNKLTPVSCIQLCQSLVHFSFEGDQSKILEKMRNYAEQSKHVFTLSQIDRFNISYKYLMVDKLIGSIKFVKFQLKRAEIADLHLVNKFNYLFILHKIKRFYIKDWTMKKQIKFQIKIGDQNRKIKIRGFAGRLNLEQQEVIAKQISNLVQRNQNAIFVKNDTSQLVMSPERLAKELMLNSKNWSYLHEIKQTSSTTKPVLQQLTDKLKEKIKYRSEHIHVVELSPMNYLNSILSYNSEAALKELFGYVKFNLFHLEFEKLLHISDLQHRKQLKQMFPLSLSQILQVQQKKQFSYITPECLLAKNSVDLIIQKDIKTVNIYLNEDQIYPYIYFLLNYVQEKKISQPFSALQNKNINVVKNKLALSSVIYGLELSLPILHQNISILRKTLFPITHQYRFSKELK